MKDGVAGRNQPAQGVAEDETGRIWIVLADAFDQAVQVIDEVVEPDHVGAATPALAVAPMVDPRHGVAVGIEGGRHMLIPADVLAIPMNEDDNCPWVRHGPAVDGERDAANAVDMVDVGRHGCFYLNQSPHPE